MKRVSRRDFLATGAAAGAAGLTPVVLADAPPGSKASSEKGGVTLEQLQLATFEPLLNTEFQVADSDGNQVTMKLVEATRGPEDPRLDQFSLVFKSPPGPVMPQGTYRFQHSGIGKADLFVVPIGQDEKGVYYQAVFNRLKN